MEQIGTPAGVLRENLDDLNNDLMMYMNNLDSYEEGILFFCKNKLDLDFTNDLDEVKTKVDNCTECFGDNICAYLAYTVELLFTRYRNVIKEYLLRGVDTSQYVPNSNKYLNLSEDYTKIEGYSILFCQYEVLGSLLLGKEQIVGPYSLNPYVDRGIPEDNITLSLAIDFLNAKSYGDWINLNK